MKKGPCNIVRSAALVLVGTLYLIGAGVEARAQSRGSGAKTDTLFVTYTDAARPIVMLGKDTVKVGGEVRIRKPYKLPIRVMNANSAFYTCTVAQEEVEVPEIQAMKTYLEALGPYALDVAKTLSDNRQNVHPNPAPAPPPSPALPLRPPPSNTFKNAKSAEERQWQQQLEQLQSDARVLRGHLGTAEAALASASTLNEQLQKIDTLLHGSSGLQAIQFRTLGALDTMSHTPTGDPSHAADRLREWLHCDSGCQRLTVTSGLLSALDRLTSAKRALRNAATTAEYQEAVQDVAEVRNELANLRGKVATLRVKADTSFQLTDIDGFEAELSRTSDRAAALAKLAAPDSLIVRADNALKDWPKIVDAAYAVQTLAVRAVAAKSAWDCDLVAADWDKGRTVTVTVAARKQPELARFAAEAPYTFKASVQPEWWIKPSVNLALLWAWDAQYPQYETKQIGESDDSLRVLLSEEMQDARFTYGLTLSASFPSLNRLTGPITVWPMEGVVNPVSDNKALGVGSAVSWGIAKVGIGYLWTRHTVLAEGQSVEQIVTKLRPKEVYFDDGSWYGSFSLMGWPPFLSSKKE